MSDFQKPLYCLAAIITCIKLRILLLEMNFYDIIISYYSGGGVIQEVN